jgi:hypothetical protein
MDEIVRQAMTKWPNVPAVFGWLSLDRRGAWLLKEESIGNPMLIEFIARNYDHDHEGRWFFQNGPQRVFVRLAYAPWVLRTASGGQFVTHTGRPVTQVLGAWFDEAGVLILQTEHGPGVLDDRDVETVSANFTTPGGDALDEDALIEKIEGIIASGDNTLAFHYQGRTVSAGRMPSTTAPARLGYVRDPQPDTASPDGAS